MDIPLYFTLKYYHVYIVLMSSVIPKGMLSGIAYLNKLHSNSHTEVLSLPYGTFRKVEGILVVTATGNTMGPPNGCF